MESFSERFKKVPIHLIQQVNGDSTEAGFRYIGECIAAGIESHLAEARREKAPGQISPLNNPKTILDFGCGLGRVILHLAERAPQTKITGFDINPSMVKWARYLLPSPNLSFVNSTLELPPASFDLVIAISVFTHLDATTDFWLSEIQRLLSINGMAVITYQDETLFEELKQKGALDSAAYLTTKYVYGRGDLEGGATMGTFYTSSFFRSLLERFFTVHLQAPRGLFDHQSLAVVTRKDTGLDQSAFLLEYTKSLERELAIMNSKNTEANASNIELRQEIIKVGTKIEANELRLSQLAQSRDRARRDLETFTHLLWKAEDERLAYEKRLNALRSSPAWPLYKRLAKEEPAPGSAAAPLEVESRAGNIAYYFYDSPFRIYRGKETLRGWCRATSGLPLSEVRARINDKLYLAHYGEKVFDLLLPDGKVLPESPCGFVLTIEGLNFGRSTLILEARIDHGPWQTWLQFPIWSVEEPDGRQ